MMRAAAAFSYESLYHRDPRHLANQLFRTFYVRAASDLRPHGGDILDPYLWRDTTSYFEGSAHQVTSRVLGSFLESNSHRDVKDPLRRAYLQRDMRAVLRWLSGADSFDQQRAHLVEQVDAVIRQLALTKAEIDQVPRALPRRSAPAAGDAWPADLSVLRASMPQLVCLGEREERVFAPTHFEFFGGRSIFHVCMDTPGGVDAATEFLDRVKRNSSDLAGLEPADGARFFLIRVAVLIDQTGDHIPSRLVESVQVMTYRSRLAARAVPLFQSFEARRTNLFSGDHRLVPIADDERRHGTFIMHGADPFERPGMLGRDSDMRGTPVLTSCRTCHDRPGAAALLSLSRVRFSPRAVPLPVPVPSSIDRESRVQLRALNRLGK